MSEEIREASTHEDYATFASLIAEYFEWMYARYAERRSFIEAVGGYQGIDKELRDVSAKFGPPAGRSFLAWRGSGAVGCVAYQDRHDGSVEMKRLFVPERHQGRGLGRRLAEALIVRARADGYALMKLDTGFLHEEAMAMYASLGFRPCEPYLDYPPDLLPHLRFFERDL